MDENPCSICLANLIEVEEIIVLDCKHGFHQACIYEWIIVNNTCPLCRLKVHGKTIEEHIVSALINGDDNKDLINRIIPNLKVSVNIFLLHDIIQQTRRTTLTSEMLSKKKKPELIDICRETHIRGYSRLKKGEIVDLILGSL